MQIDFKKWKKKIEGYADLNRQIISAIGEVEVISAQKKGDKPYDEDYRKDFLMFCFLKYTKTLNSILVLLENNLNEDALILTRSNYEVLMHAKALVKDKDMINHFLHYKLGLENERHYRYASYKNGKKNPNKIVDNENPGRMITYISSISKIAYRAGESTSYKHIYKFLCEQTHCNFLTSGYYRNETGTYYTLENGTDGARHNVMLFNVGFCLKFYDSLLKTDLLGEDFEEFEDVICSILIEDKLKLQEIFEIEEKRIETFIKEVDSQDGAEYLRLVTNIKRAMIMD